MNQTSSPLPPKQTFFLLVHSMVATVVCLRLHLHLVGVHHVYPGGYLVHHLYTGILIVVPAAFVLAFGTRYRLIAMITRVALGVGAGLVLDEMTYLVMTGASDGDYVSSTSLGGAVAFVAAAIALVYGLYRWHDCRRMTDGLKGGSELDE